MNTRALITSRSLRLKLRLFVLRHIFGVVRASRCANKYAKHRQAASMAALIATASSASSSQLARILTNIRVELEAHRPYLLHLLLRPPVVAALQLRGASAQILPGWTTTRLQDSVVVLDPGRPKSIWICANKCAKIQIVALQNARAQQARPCSNFVKSLRHARCSTLHNMYNYFNMSHLTFPPPLPCTTLKERGMHHHPEDKHYV
mmetsp:Transcript_11604/g.19262  ORF Transcript_11604/g.19262 Transcript_11604/m.19262 type:complete len:205 (+) Transcript_11604:761-1375(+)